MDMFTSDVTESMVTTALLGLLTALRHRADIVLDNEQKPYNEESVNTLVSAAGMLLSITGVLCPFSMISPETSSIETVIIIINLPPIFTSIFFVSLLILLVVL